MSKNLPNIDIFGNTKRSESFKIGCVFIMYKKTRLLNNVFVFDIIDIPNEEVINFENSGSNRLQ